MDKIKKRILVSGTMRSGTTLMAAVLNSHPSITLITDKLKWFWTRVIPSYGDIPSSEKLERVLYEQEHWIKLSLQMDNEKYYKMKNYLLSNYTEKSNSNERLYDLIFKYVSGSFNSIIGDKSTHASESYNYYLNTFSNSYIIHMIRNPYDVYYSQNTKVFKDRNPGFIQKSKLQLKQYFINKLYSKNFYYQAGNLLTRNYYRDDPMKIIDYWKEINEKALSLKEKYPNRVMIIKYEDLILDNSTQINNITNLLNIDFKQEYFLYDNLKTDENNSFKSNSSFVKTIGHYDSSRIGYSKDKLSVKELKYISDKVPDLNKMFDY